MQRAVQRKRLNIGKKVVNGNKPKRNKRQRQQQFKLCLLLTVLIPLAIIGTAIYVLNQAEAELESSTETKHEILTPEAVLNKSNRLLKSQIIDDDANTHRDEKEIHGVKRLDEKQMKAEASKSDQLREKFLILTTEHGNIKITLRPDISQGSVNYIYELVKSYGGNGKRCMHCSFYRSEEHGILQGIMEHRDVVPVNTVRGLCPPGAEEVSNECPDWDKQCGCHGPVMTRGAVAWAAGDAGGPDFFIDGYKKPANWWGTQHTNFGFIEDEASLNVIDAILGMPTELEGGMEYLKEPIHFDLVLE